MSVKALRDWLTAYRMDLLRDLDRTTPEQGVRVLNEVTGLSLRSDYETRRYIEDMQNSVAMGRLRSATNQYIPAIVAATSSAFCGPTPNPAPEPNKVLLLLGEDE